MKVSIITATYNCEESVCDAVDSVLSQTYSNIEYIIVDGASSDNTLLMINDRIETSTSNITPIIISEPDNGIYDALNKGIKTATGDVIAFLHADDIYTSSTVIQRVVDCFSKNKEQKSKNIDSVYGDLEYVNKENTDKVIRYWQSGECTESKLSRGWMPPHPAFFVRREIYSKFGVFDTTLRIAADYDFMMRVLFKHKISSAYVPEVFIKMRVGGESNRSLKNLIIKSREDLQAMKNNGMGGIFALLLKNLSKIKQFISRRS